MNWGIQLMCPILLSALLLNIYQAKPGGVKHCHTEALIYGLYGTIYSPGQSQQAHKAALLNSLASFTLRRWRHWRWLPGCWCHRTARPHAARLPIPGGREAPGVTSSHGRLSRVTLVLFRARTSASVRREVVSQRQQRLYCHHPYWSRSEASELSVWPPLLSNRPRLHAAPCWMRSTAFHILQVCLLIWGRKGPWMSECAKKFGQNLIPLSFWWWSWSN